MPFYDLDIFPKFREDYSRRTTSSGAITLSCILIMIFLFVFQTYRYFTEPLSQKITIDETPLPTDEEGYLLFKSLPKLTMNFDIILYSLPCAFVNFGILDQYKSELDDSFSLVKLTRLSPNGTTIKTQMSNESTSAKKDPSYCGSCYGLRGGCCNTCKEVHQAYKLKGKLAPPASQIEQCQSEALEYSKIKDEHCQLSGFISVPPSHGSFFISPANSYGERAQYVNDYLAMGLTLDDFNFSHKINHFYVSDRIPYRYTQRKNYNRIMKRMSRMVSGFQKRSPLNGIVKIQKNQSRYKALYFIRAVKEVADEFRYQYHITTTHYDRYREGSSSKFPGLYFHYNVAPIMVQYKREVSVLRFLVTLMGTLGGVYALGSLLDHLIPSTKTPKAFIN